MCTGKVPGPSPDLSTPSGVYLLRTLNRTPELEQLARSLSDSVPQLTRVLVSS